MKKNVMLLLAFKLIVIFCTGCPFITDDTQTPCPTPAPTPSLSSENMIYNGDFSNGFDHWMCWINTDEGADGFFAIINSMLHAVILAGGDETSWILIAQGDLSLEQNYQYTLTFDAHAENKRTIEVSLFEGGIDNNGDGNSYTTYDSCIVSLNQVPATYTVNFIMREINDPGARIGFNFGKHSADVCVDTISLVKEYITIPAPGTEMVRNGDFSDGMNCWMPWMTNGADAVYTVEDGVLHIAIHSPGDTPWELNVSQTYPGLRCITGKNYRLTFNAWTDAGRTMDAGIDENGYDVNENDFAWDAYGYKVCSITTEPATYTIDFTMPVTDYDARLVFHCGATEDDLYIDNVSVKEVP
ncbi:MAG: carbohydrate binding domain-containing protein [Spirochaetales bacterium]|nr:carbohydrate binding domain-containing protein [Spirochaetales bacterium]